MKKARRIGNFKNKKIKLFFYSSLHHAESDYGDENGRAAKAGKNWKKC